MDSNVPSDQQVRASALTLATAIRKPDSTAASILTDAEQFAVFMFGTNPPLKASKSPKAPAAVTAASSVPPAANPAAPPSAALASLIPAAAPTTAPLAAATAAPQSAPVAAQTAAPIGVPAPSTIAPPTTVAAVAESLRACVQDKAPGRGRDVAVAILAQFGVTTLAQVPPT